MDVIVVGPGNYNIKSVIKSKGIQVVESATDYYDQGLPAVFKNTKRYVEAVLTNPFSYNTEWLFRDYGHPYHAAHGHQALFWRYNPKEKHNQIKPRKGYKLKRFNRKSFRKTAINFR